MLEKLEFIEKIFKKIYETVFPFFPHLIVLIIIGYLAGIIFIITQNPLPYIVGPRQEISIIYSGSSSQQTIAEGVVIFIMLLIIFLSLFTLYSYGTKRFHTQSPTFILAFSMFILFIFFLILWVMLIPKFQPLQA